MTMTTKKDIIEEKIKRVKKQLISAEKKVTDLNNELTKWIEKLEKSESPETIDIYIMFFDDFICGVFDSIEKAESKKGEFIYKNRHWCGKDADYRKFSIKKYNISKPINNKVFVLNNDSTDNFCHIFGLENEYYDYIIAFDSHTYEKDYYINEVRG